MKNLHRFSRAYSLVEVLIAGALLALGVAAAAIFANTIFINQEASALTTRALNVQEQAGRLYSLGLEPDEITNLLPEWCVDGTPQLGSLRFEYTVATNTLAGVGEVEAATNRIIFPSINDASGTLRYRSNSVLLVRPVFR